MPWDVTDNGQRLQLYQDFPPVSGQNMHMRRQVVAVAYLDLEGWEAFQCGHGVIIEQWLRYYKPCAYTFTPSEKGVRPKV